LRRQAFCYGPPLSAWVPALGPLTYTASVLALILAAGTTSGVGIVILVPLIWTVLFQRWRESALVLLAIVIVEIVISLVPAAVPAAVIARRAVLWAALGTLIIVATHGLRDRIARSQGETARLQAHMRQASVVQDRDRIAAGLENTVIQRLFAVGLNLQGAAALIAEPAGRERVESAVSELDQVIAAIRDAIFARERTAAENKGLRAEIIELFTQTGPASHVRFSGPVDESLQPQVRDEFLQVLREALGIIKPHYAIACVEVTAGHDSSVAAIEASPSGGTHLGPGGFDAQGLRHGAAAAGVSVDIVTEPTGARFAWVIPLT
jgi:signal transduction histidine kinase